MTAHRTRSAPAGFHEQLASLREGSHKESPSLAIVPAPEPPNDPQSEKPKVAPQQKEKSRKSPQFGGGERKKEVRSEVRQEPRAASTEAKVEMIRLGELRYVDLGVHVQMRKDEGVECLFAFYEGHSCVTFMLSVLPGPRVLLLSREANGLFAEPFKKGTELFQDEIYGIRKPPEVRQGATKTFNDVRCAIEEQYVARKGNRSPR